MQNGLVSLLWFGVIVALIPLALWLLKRTPLAGQGSGRPGTPRAVAVLPLAANSRLVTVEVGLGAERQWLVLGVTAQHIQTLHTMAAGPEGSVTTIGPPGSAAFAQLLSRLRGRSDGSDAQR
jgi:flagellar protein FliO/FliZ